MAARQDQPGCQRPLRLCAHARSAACRWRIASCRGWDPAIGRWLAVATMHDSHEIGPFAGFGPRPLEPVASARPKRLETLLREEKMGWTLDRRAFLTALAATAPALRTGARGQNDSIRVGLLCAKTGPLAEGGIQMEQGLTTFSQAEELHARGPQDQSHRRRPPPAIPPTPRPRRRSWSSRNRHRRHGPDRFARPSRRWRSPTI